MVPKTPLLYYELLVVLHSQTLVYLASCAIVVIFLNLWDHHNVNVYYYSIFMLSLKSLYNCGWLHEGLTRAVTER